MFEHGINGNDIVAVMLECFDNKADLVQFVAKYSF